MNFVIKTSDNQLVEVTEEMVNFSNIWKEMTDDISDEDTNRLPTNIRSELLVKVIEFIKMSLTESVGEIPKPLPSDSNSFSSVSGIPSWAEDWLNPMTKQELQFTVLCANYLDIQPLLHLCTAYIAFGIKGKTPDEIKDMWKDVVDPSPVIA